MKVSILLIEILAASYLPNLAEWGKPSLIDSDASADAVQNEILSKLAAEALAKQHLLGADAEKSIKPSGSVKNLKNDDRSDDGR